MVIILGFILTRELKAVCATDDYPLQLIIGGLNFLTNLFDRELTDQSWIKLNIRWWIKSCP